MESIVKLGEVEMKMTGDVKTTEDLKVLLRRGWGAETTGKLVIQPATELKAGDGVRVVIEKVVYVPDPVEEKAPETFAVPEAAASNCSCKGTSEEKVVDTTAKEGR